ncbi:hypothetical protein PAHAL_5G008300 [Panicum hallii]|jgi:hypothetical protein|uniref:Uncharacterized protein n=1 Tax=Panicum hallii TaxID=206008 RepID=A0A2T8IIG1_9POAL|nr:hypothetical protein PAHAL_5G008300 [Panicum hallii]
MMGLMLVEQSTFLRNFMHLDPLQSKLVGCSQLAAMQCFSPACCGFIPAWRTLATCYQNKYCCLDKAIIALLPSVHWVSFFILRLLGRQIDSCYVAGCEDDLQGQYGWNLSRSMLIA